MVKDKVLLVTFQNPMVTSGVIPEELLVVLPVELLVVFPLSADTACGKAVPNRSMRVNTSVLNLFIYIPSWFST